MNRLITQQLKHKESIMIRQGDLLLMPVLAMPKKVARAPHKVLAFGETMGHSHRFESSDVDVFFDSQLNTFCRVSKPAELIHEEHENIQVPPGKYLVVQQRQLDMRRHAVATKD